MKAAEKRTFKYPRLLGEGGSFLIFYFTFVCGIFGYIGQQRKITQLIEGLRRLEYRGYDSSGIAAHANNAIYLKKSVGKIDSLVATLDPTLESGLAISHCLHPRSVIQLSNGQTAFIENLPIKGKLISLNTQLFHINNDSFTLFTHKSPKYLYRVRTPFSSFVATENHKTLVLSNGVLQEKQVKDLCKGDFLPLPKKLIITQTKSIIFLPIEYKRYYALTNQGADSLRRAILTHSTSKVALNTGIAASYLRHMLANDRNIREDKLKSLYNLLGRDFARSLEQYFNEINTIHGKFITLPEVSSPQLMQILGYLIGDAYVAKKTIRFKDMNQENLATYKTLIEEVFHVSGRIATMNDTRAMLLECNSFYLCGWLQQNVIKDKQAFVSLIGGLPNDQLAKFIRGLFDAEGFVGVKAGQIGLAMVNEFLIRSLQLWLLRFGIAASLLIEPPNSKFKRTGISCKLSISNQESIKNFNHYIGFSSSVKHAKLLQIAQRVGTRKLSVKHFSSFTEIAFTRILDVQRILSDTDIVYDLEVKSSQTFLANSLFTHNSRWATHGQPTETNAHPHYDCNKNIFVVHNGIIENYKVLKDALVKKGHKFVSDTDTEVLPHLIEEERKQADTLEDAVIRALQKVKGTYGLAIMAKADPNKLIAARNSSPLLVGMGRDEYFIASDASAVLDYTKKVVYLNDGEVAVIGREAITFTNLSYAKLRKKPEVVEWSLEDAQKGGYVHFMLKEICEQPEALKDTLRGRLLIDQGNVRLGGLQPITEKLRGIKRLIITGMGTALLAGAVGEYMIEEYAGIPVEVENAAEFRYRKPLIDKHTAFLVVSQSGETADTLAALREAKEKGALTLGIVNVVGSTLARETDAGVYNHAGPEIGVASTKAFTSQLAVLALLTLALGRTRQMSLTMGKRIAQELARIPQLAQEVIKQARDIEALAKKYQHQQNFLFLGRKYNLPVAYEGALKLKEISYIHAEGYGAGEMKHGPIALIDENFPCVVLAPKDSVYDKTLNNIQQIKARKGKIIAITTKGNDEIKAWADDVVYIPKTLEMLTPLLSVIPLQLFAYYMGVTKGYDVDKPRNLAKSVTVE